MPGDATIKKRIPAWRKLLYVGVVFCLFLSFVEIALRLHGLIALKTTRGNLPADRDRVILCLGDSFTYGIGAGAGESYPAHLQRMISQVHPEGVRVVNLGHPYMDSTSLLAALPDYLDRWNPDVVLLLAGYNNRFRKHADANKKGARAFLKKMFGSLKIYQFARIIWINLNVDPNSRIDPNVPALEAKEIAGVLENREEFAKVKKIFEPYAMGQGEIAEPADGDPAQQYIAYGLFLITKSRTALAEEYLHTALKLAPDNLLATMGIGYIYLYRNELVMGFRKARFDLDSSWLYAGMAYYRMDAGDYEGAIRFFEESRRIEPYFLPVPHGLAMTYLKMGRPDDALFQLLAAEALEPWNAEIQWTKGEILLAAGEGQKAVEAFELSLDYSHRHPGHYARIARAWVERPENPDRDFQETVTASIGPRSADWQLLGRWTKNILAKSDEGRAALNLIEDLDDMADIMEEREIPIILMSYPDTFYRNRLADFARRRGIVFVDHTPVFKEIMRNHQRGEIFRRDGHCTAKGYKVMADNLLQTLDEMELSGPRVSP